MRYILVIISIVLFSGCYTLSPEKASMLTPHQLCQHYVGEPFATSKSQSVAYNELRTRGISCDLDTYQALRSEKLEKINDPFGDKYKQDTVRCTSFLNSIKCKED